MAVLQNADGEIIDSKPVNFQTTDQVTIKVDQGDAGATPTGENEVIVAPEEITGCGLCKKFFDFTCYVKSICIKEIVISVVVIVVTLIVLLIIAIIMIVSCIYCPGCYIKLACCPIKILKTFVKNIPKPTRK